MSPLASTPPPAAPVPTAHVRFASGAPAGWQGYTVRAGDTLFDIARRLGTTPSVLAAQNALPNGGRLIRTGSVILVPGPQGPAAPAAPTPAAPASAPAQDEPASSANAFAGRTYPEATVAAATAARDTLKRSAVPGRQAMRSILEATARRHGVDPKLALAVAYQESGWDQRQVSVANAIGAMQVIPSSGRWASSLAGRPLDLLKAEDNATAGVVILRALTRAAASQNEVIAGYYQGLASVRARGMFADTKDYVASVTAAMSRS